MDEDEKASRDNDHWLVNNLPKFWPACPALRVCCIAQMTHSAGVTPSTGGLASAGPGHNKTGT